MTDITVRDPLRSLISWPKWFDDYDISRNSGLKVRETDTDIVAEAVVAGIKPEDIDIHIEDGVLTIKAQAKNEDSKNQGGKSSYYYYYSAALGGGEWNKAQAEIENGVVTITIPKAESARPQKIKVTAKKA